MLISFYSSNASTMLFTITTWVALIAYLLGSWQQRQQLFHGSLATSDTPQQSQTIKPALIGIFAWFLHGISLYDQVFSTQGLLLDLGSAMSLTAWCVTGVIMVICYRQPAASLLVGMFPFAGCCLLFASLAPATAAPIAASIADNPAFLGHILFSFLAYALLAVAALLALLLAWQMNLLKSRQQHSLLRILPPLQAMESLLFGMLTTGVGLLTLSLLTGFLFLQDLFAQQLTHKTVLSICAWFVFMGLLMGHYYLGWRGRTAVRWTLTGFGFLLVAFFGSKLIIEYLL